MGGNPPQDAGDLPVVPGAGDDRYSTESFAFRGWERDLFFCLRKSPVRAGSGSASPSPVPGMRAACREQMCRMSLMFQKVETLPDKASLKPSSLNDGTDLRISFSFYSWFFVVCFCFFLQ